MDDLRRRRVHRARFFNKDSLSLMVVVVVGTGA
jgi:hypothetical protein